MPYTTCRVCKVLIRVPLCKLETRKYCSRECQAKIASVENSKRAREANKRKGQKPNLRWVGRVVRNWTIVSFSQKRYEGQDLRHFWTVRCNNCGIEREYNITNIKRGGCSHCLLMPKAQSGLNELLYCYKRNAEAKSREFTLSEEQFKTLTGSRCHYCGSLPRAKFPRRKKVSDWGIYTYNGIDRIDSDAGYVPSNCVPCCSICNKAKMRHSYDKFVAHVRRFANNVAKSRVACLSDPVP